MEARDAEHEAAELYVQQKYPNAMYLLNLELDDLTKSFERALSNEAQGYDDAISRMRMHAEQALIMAQQDRNSLLQGNVIPAIKRVQRYIDKLLLASKDRHAQYGVVFGRPIPDCVKAPMQYAIRELIRDLI